MLCSFIAALTHSSPGIQHYRLAGLAARPLIRGRVPVLIDARQATLPRRVERWLPQRHHVS